MFRLSDSCGVSIGGWVSVSVCCGCVGSVMSSTTTPMPFVFRLKAFSGNSSAVS